MTQNADLRAVESCEALLNAPAANRQTIPGGLITEVRLPANSGDRHVAAHWQ